MMRRAHSTTFRKALAAAAAAGLAAAVLGLSGCSRRQMNYQIAEAIGTDGKYENNEPVETPKMKEQRAAQEQSESEEQNVSKILQTAGFPAILPWTAVWQRPESSMRRATQRLRPGMETSPICVFRP